MTAAPTKTKFNYRISSRLDEENKKIILNGQIISSISPFYYESSLSIEDFIKLNKNFKVYDDINEINSFIIESIQEKTISIEEGINNENIKIIFHLYNLKGNKENFEITLEKKDMENNEIINALINQVNNLILENQNLNMNLNKSKEEIDSLRNIIYHKMDSLIINNENEQIFLENRLKKIKIFSGKKFLSRLLFRASIHGDRADIFHNLCDYKSNLLFLVKTEKNKRFGGFISKPILPKNYNKCIKDNEAFCFSLDLNKIYNIKGDEAIYLNDTEIITFLMDIFKIYDKFFSQKSICTDAREDQKYIYYDNQSSKYEINGGETSFIVKELEVFEIIFI